MNKIIRISTFVFFLTVAFTATALSSQIYDTARTADTRVLTIQEAVQMALARSPEVLLAEAQKIRSGEAVRESRSLNQPQIYTGSGLAYNNGMPLSIEGAAPSIIQIRMSKSIFSKKNNNLIREAEEIGKSSRLNKESVENDLASRTASTYYRLHQARRMVAISQSRVESVQRQMEMAENLFSAGRMSPIEVASVKTATSSARQQLLVLKEQEQLAEMELKSYTGLPESVSIHTVGPQIISPLLEKEADILYLQALENAPEIRQAESDIRARGFHLEAEKGERLPKLNIVGQYALLSDANNYREYFNRFERNNYLVGLSIQFPIFDGFRSGARISQSRQDIQEARYRFENLKSELKLSVYRALSDLRIARGAREHALNDVDAVRENIKASEVLLENGRISRKDFEEIKAELFQKELVNLEAEQDLFQRELELLGLIGGVPSAFE